MHTIKYTFLFVFGFYLASAQTSSTRIDYRYHIKKSDNTIRIDGIESEGEWEKYPLIQELYNHNPSDEGFAKNRTEIKLTYDGQMLYIIAKNYDTGSRVVQSLQRDSENALFNSDSFAIVLDPINSKQNGVLFAVNAGGAEMDAVLGIEAFQTKYFETWDEKWFSSVKSYKDHWIVEFAIPFSSLRYNEENLEWGINFIRGDKVENFDYTWTQFPLNFDNFDLNYMGSLVWSEIPIVKSNALFIKPYATISSVKDSNQNNFKNNNEIDAGIDFKIPITKSLFGDLSINPDFSNADVDQEIVNITRFNILLPERREFFLENNDIFTNIGFGNLKPFISRRIGIENGQNIPITFGAKVTGNLGTNFRLGVMNVQTNKSGEIPSSNNSVIAVNHNILKRSIIKGMFINKTSSNENGASSFSQNFGTEFKYISSNGNLVNTVSYNLSRVKNFENGFFLGMEGSYNSRRYGFGWALKTITGTYRADLGFTPLIFNFNAETGETITQGYTLANPWFKYYFFPKKNTSVLFRHGLRTWHNFFFNQNELFERQNNFAYDFIFRNTASLIITIRGRGIELRYPTNFLGDEFNNLPRSYYNFWTGTVNYSSDVRKKVSYTIGGVVGSFYNGKIASFSTSCNFRTGSWGNFNVAYDLNRINLPSNFGNVALHLLKFNGALSFTNKLFLSNTVQFNTQSENFSIFSRLQWRYSPLSDIFLVYNQNNDTQEFDLSNRSIILKVTHRFGI